MGIENLELFGQFTTYKFTDIWEDFETFKNDYLSSPLSVIDENKLEILFYLLYAEYGNSSIANFDENQFKFKVYSLIYQYGPMYFKQREVQDAIRALDISSADVLMGTKAIYNTAQNPSTEPSTGSLEELIYIDSQNTTNYKRSKLEGYANYYDLLSRDTTKDFLDKFKKLFIIVVAPQKPLLYPSID